MTGGYNNKIATLSFLGALCVVLIHIGVKAPEGSFSWWVYQLTANGFCRWAVPFFFAAAGYFLAAHVDEPGWWKNAIRKRVRTLLIPFLIWNVLYSIYGLSLTIIANIMAGRELTANMLTGWDVLMYFGIHPLKGGNYGVLWFVETLFLFVIFSPVLVASIRRSGWLVPIALFGLSYAGLPSMPHNFNPGWMMYFAAGIAARFRPVYIGKYFGGGVILGMIWIYLHKKYMLDNAIVGHWASTPLTAVIMVVIGVWALMPSSISLPRALLSATFPIYLLHCFFIKACVCAIPPIHVFMWQIVEWIAVVVACAMASILIRRFVPRLAGLAFGGRS